MRPFIQEISSPHTPESLLERVQGTGAVLLRTGSFDSPQSRYSFIAARPFLTMRSFGSRCEFCHPGALTSEPGKHTQFGSPWRILEGLMARYELPDEPDLPFPLGGCFGYWGYDLKEFLETRLPRRAVDDLELPGCQVGFYHSLVAFDHHLGKTWIISTGLGVDGSRDEDRAREQLEFWREKIQTPVSPLEPRASRPAPHAPSLTSDLSRAEFIARVERAIKYIRSGDIYQVNLSHRLASACGLSGWEFFQRLASISPAPFSAYLDCGDFQVVSSSPELFLRLSGSHILTRPIKGTRPRSADADRDAQLTYELQTSPKEMAELVMITDLLRNDLGRVCEFGSVRVPELVRLERHPQVQHLVSTVEGRLRKDVSHFGAFASCFPGGSITGAPKIRAMEIIDELEPVTRGPYTGALGYLGFNRESQLAITIRTAVCREGTAYFHAGAGIVADSIPEAEYEETLAKAAGFLAALNLERSTSPSQQPTSR
ncbi:MAG TPA: anthranilate synthase component I family protein [Verrucomicrobiae bacterium]|jgi:para-aminobenzoate synthetase component 1|nr:anthranilate synthase component I family protein [Verrucomicrobiae bacterium]